MTRVRLSILVCLLFSLAACTSTPPPVQQMSDARLAIAAAEAGEADKYASETIDAARARLRRAEMHLGRREYISAGNEANRAKRLATEARVKAEAAGGKPRHDDSVPPKP